MTEPLKIPRFIKLTVREPLDRRMVSAWCNTVREAAPKGVMVITIQTVDDKGQPRGVKIVRREYRKKQSYLVPLTRDLLPDETEEIVNAFANKHPEMDFDIETNQTRLTASQRHAISVDQTKYLELCTALAKHKHEDWIRERSDAGWRYGTNFSMVNKTNPLIMPWDQLPDRYRVPDMELPQKLVDVLGEYGYAVVSQDEIAKLLALLKA